MADDGSKASGPLIGLRSAIYPVSDPAAARDWYAALFGKAPYFDSPFYVGFELGGFEFGLLKSDDAGTGGVRAMWGVADIEAALQQIQAAGGALIEPVAEVGGGIKTAGVRDPFGNHLGVIENPLFDISACD